MELDGSDPSTYPLELLRAGRSIFTSVFLALQKPA